MTSTAAWAIEAHGVRKAFGDTHALDGVDLRAETGKVLALLGPTAHGQDDTRANPDDAPGGRRGRARVAGFDVVHDAAAVRSMIGLSGQFAAIDNLLTGRENLEMVGELYRLGRREARRRAAEALDQFGLAEAGDRLA